MTKEESSRKGDLKGNLDSLAGRVHEDRSVGMASRPLKKGRDAVMSKLLVEFGHSNEGIPAWASEREGWIAERAIELATKDKEVRYNRYLCEEMLAEKDRVIGLARQEGFVDGSNAEIGRQGDFEKLYQKSKRVNIKLKAENKDVMGAHNDAVKHNNEMLHERQKLKADFRKAKAVGYLQAISDVRKAIMELKEAEKHG